MLSDPRLIILCILLLLDHIFKRGGGGEDGVDLISGVYLTQFLFLISSCRLHGMKENRNICVNTS